MITTDSPPPSRKQRIQTLLFRVFIGSSVIILGWWLFYVPSNPRRLYQAIPADAAYISAHVNLAGRWPVLAANPVTSSLIKAFPDIRPAGVLSSNELASSPWLNRLVSRETVFAYLPACGNSRKPAWIAATWVGGYSQVLRWLLYWNRVPGATVTGHFGVHPVWELKTRAYRPGMRCSIAVTEGVLMACFSSEPHGIHAMLAAYDGVSLSLDSVMAEPRGLRMEACSDAGWIKPVHSRSLSQAIHFTIPRLTDRELTCLMTASDVLPPLSQPIDRFDTNLFEHVLGDLPGLVMIVPVSFLHHLSSLDSSPSWLKIMDATLLSHTGSNSTDYVVSAMFTGDYGGGIGKEPFRAKLPSLLVFCKLAEPDTNQRRISELMDRLNAQYNLGLIVDPMPLTNDPTRVQTIEPTLDNGWNLDPTDRPSYAVYNNWLILSSHAQSLVQLLNRAFAEETKEEACPGRWLHAFTNQASSACLWLDFKSGAKILQLAAGSFSLWFPREQSNVPPPSTAQGIIAFKQWVNQMNSNLTCVIRMEPDRPQTLMIEIK